MTDSTYNQWYCHTYEKIRTMARWDTFSADIEAKVICIFSWMPQTILGINHSGKGHGAVKKWQEFPRVEDVAEKVREAEAAIKSLDGIQIETADFKSAPIVTDVKGAYEALVQPFGATASSKYLHFSCRELFMMWDRGLRSRYKLGDSSDDYVKYLLGAQQVLMNPMIRMAAEMEYPSNVLRGLDIYRMKMIRTSEGKQR